MEMKIKGSSQGALPAVASRLAPIGGAIWNNFYLIIAAMFVAMAFLPEPVSVRVNDCTLGVWAFLTWSFERQAQAERKGTKLWRAAAKEALELIPQRSMTWTDFCARVEDNMPDEQREAVRYALELAVASELAETAH